jgi:nucleoid-associated protein YgaU
MSLLRAVPVSLIVLLSASVLLVSCSLIEGDDESAGNARVISVQMSNEVGADGVPVNPRNAFAPPTREIRAAVRLESVETGMRVSGKWFQLGTASAGAEGAEVSGSEVTLDSTTVSEQGNSRIFFSLSTNGPSLPADSWLLRVYINDQIVKTSGFVISPLVGADAAPPAAPATTNYTVVAGDTLASVAQRFLPAGETVQSFVTRIATLNNIAATAALSPGQVLRVPTQ